jgi:hypothetical protein
MIPAGGFWTLSNYMPTPAGLKRRPGIVFYSGGNGVASLDTPQIDIAPLWKTNGTQNAVLLTSRYLYVVSGYAAPTAYHWVYDVGTCSVSGTTVTGAGGTLWDTDASLLLEGDYIVLDADGSGDGPEEIQVSAINSDTEIILTSTPTGTYGAGTDYEIRRALHADTDTLLDWTVCDNAVVIADHNRTPYKFDGTSFTYWDTFAALPYIPGCVVFFNDRLWMGNTIESGVKCRQRIRWSNATDHTDFNSADYYDIPYSSGFLRRLVPLGQYLVAYFEDAIYIGRRSNYVNLPYQFDVRVESRGIGLVGTKAVVPALNGHIFVGQDDVYFLSATGELQPLTCPVRDDMVRNCSTMGRIYLARDSVNDRVILGFPEGGTSIEKAWTYNYRTKAWAYDDINADALTNPELDLGLTWDDLTALLGGSNNWDTGMASFGSWDAIGAGTTGGRLFMLNGLYIYIYSQSADTDESGNIISTIETGDMDLNAPDDDKTVTRFSMRLAARPSADLSFVITGSVDSGNTWKSLGTLEIDTDHIEGKVDFFLTGSAVRFRLVEQTAVEPYTISEFVLRTAGRGIEVHFD